MNKQGKELSSCFGDYIKSLRLVKGLRLKDVSDRSSISIAYLNRLENNKRMYPSVKVLRKLANALEVSVMDLLQISLRSDYSYIKSLNEIILEGNYTIGGVRVSQEAKILLWDIIRCILDDESRNKGESDIFIDNLVSRIKCLNKLI